MSTKENQTVETAETTLDVARGLAQRARNASRLLGSADTNRKNLALQTIARLLMESSDAILAANAQDLEDAKKENISDALLDRLTLNPQRIGALSESVLAVAALPDPVGEVTSTWQRPNGLQVQKVRISLGVVLMIYEARPNVTTDSAALCLKSGNAIILRGGKEALRTNLALAGVVAQGLKQADLPPDGVQLVNTPDRQVMLDLLHQDELIDVVMPRGGEGLIRFVAQSSRIPVLKHYKGVCHVYIHGSADLKKAVDIVLNAKVQRPGVCNAAECLLIDRAALPMLPTIARALVEKRVELRCCPTSLAALERDGVVGTAAKEDDWGREFLDRIIAVRVVKDLDEAMAHIARYGSLHTEAVVAQDISVATRFAREVVASAVMINASTRFNDGGELGLGAEIGISTSKLHAFGPMGLAELTAQRFVVLGDGQVRI